MPDEGKITIKCSSCGKHFKAPAKLAGQKARCPCGQVLDVPPKMETGSEGPVEEAWYYLKDGEREGPLTKDGLENQIEEGVVEPADRVWKQGMASWKPASEVEELSFEASSTADAGGTEKKGEPPTSKEMVEETEEEAEKEAEKEKKAGQEKSESSDKKTEAKKSASVSGTSSKSSGRSKSTRGRRRSQSLRQRASEAPELPIVRVVSWGLIGVGGVCLLAGLIVSIILLVKHGIGGPPSHVANFTLAGCAALFGGASLWAGRAAVQGIWKIARGLGDR